MRVDAESCFDFGSFEYKLLHVDFVPLSCFSVFQRMTFSGYKTVSWRNIIWSLRTQRKTNSATQTFTGNM